MAGDLQQRIFVVLFPQEPWQHLQQLVLIFLEREGKQGVQGTFTALTAEHGAAFPCAGDNQVLAQWGGPGKFLLEFLSEMTLSKSRQPVLFVSPRCLPLPMGQGQHMGAKEDDKVRLRAASNSVIVLLQIYDLRLRY